MFLRKFSQKLPSNGVFSLIRSTHCKSAFRWGDLSMLPDEEVATSEPRGFDE